MTMGNRSTRVLLGVSGGIAAYKIPQLIRTLIRDGCEVKVVITTSAFPLVGTDALRTVSKNHVYTDSSPSNYDMDHIRLAEWADVFCIVPATANTIGKLACGIADNLLTTLAISFETTPLIVAPAMNSAMWCNPAVEKNVATLKHRGIRVLPVGTGELACGSEGSGRLISFDVITSAINGATSNCNLYKKRVLIASGPTEEAIDPVRVLTNRSSGKMGASLSAAALAFGAEVTVVTGPASVPLPDGIKCIKVKSAIDMLEAMKTQFNDCDICIMAAAISDYKVSNFSTEKIRCNGSEIPKINLAPNEDILKYLCSIKKGQMIIGFSLESDGGIKRALEKMEEKGSDMMVFNQVSSAIGTISSEITILDTTGKIESFALASKESHAVAILAHAELLAKRLHG